MRQSRALGQASECYFQGPYDDSGFAPRTSKGSPGRSIQRRSQGAIVELRYCAVSGNDPCGHRVGAPCWGGSGFDANERHEVGSEIQVLCG